RCRRNAPSLPAQHRHQPAPLSGSGAGERGGSAAGATPGVGAGLAGYSRTLSVAALASDGRPAIDWEWERLRAAGPATAGHVRHFYLVGSLCHGIGSGGFSGFATPCATLHLHHRGNDMTRYARRDVLTGSLGASLLAAGMGAPFLAGRARADETTF